MSTELRVGDLVTAESDNSAYIVEGTVIAGYDYNGVLTREPGVEIDRDAHISIRDTERCVTGINGWNWSIEINPFSCAELLPA